MIKRDTLTTAAKQRLLLVGLAATAVLLVLYGVLRASLGLRLPDKLDRAVPEVVTLLAVSVFLYNRSLASKAAKEARDDAKAGEGESVAEAPAAASAEPGSSSVSAAASAGASPESAEPDGGSPGATPGGRD